MTSSILGDGDILLAANSAVDDKLTHVRKTNEFEDRPSLDHILRLLEAILQEQASLRSVFQGHQVAIFQKLDDLKVSSASSIGENNLDYLLSNGEAGHFLTVAEVGDLEEEAQKWFRNIDTDQGETLPRDELKKLLNTWVASAKPLFKARLQLKSEEDVDAFIEELDTSGNGMIGEKLFQEKLKRIRGGMVDGKFETPQGLRSFLAVHKKRSLVEKIVLSTTFDMIMSYVIVVNVITMLIGLQMQGLHLGLKLGLRHGDLAWSTYRRTFAILGLVFNATYLLELILRLWAQGLWFLKQPLDIIDAIIVGISCLDSFVLKPLEINFVNVSILRFIRIARVFRLLKILRFSQTLSELRVMVDTLCQSIRGVFWAIVLLGAIIAAGGALMTQVTAIIVENPDVDIESRVWLYTYFGTVAVSMHTMFECTFSGHWWFYTRPLIEEVHYSFAVFWLTWVILVNFAAIRVVGAIFLKQTMNASVADAEKCAMTQLKRKGALSESLRVMFESVDTSSDGAITQDEFDAMIANKEVIEAFANMGLGVDAVTAFFSVLTSDDGKADYNEFVNGALAMATSSPTLDSLKTLQYQLKMQEDVADILKSVQSMKKLVPLVAACAELARFSGGSSPETQRRSTLNRL